MPDINRSTKVANVSSIESSSPRLVVMCGDIEVFNVNMDLGDVTLVNESLLPFRLKGAFKFHESTGNPEKDYKYICKYFFDNRYTIFNWLAGRTLLLSRMNAKKLYQAFRLEQLQDDISRAELAMS